MAEGQMSRPKFWTVKKLIENILFVKNFWSKNAKFEVKRSIMKKFGERLTIF